MPLVLAEQRWLRFGAFSAFYFAQGVPNGLLAAAIPVWLAEKGVSDGDTALYLTAITLPWALKLVTGPFMDRFTYLAMGFRRPWVALAQGGLTASLLALALVDVGASLLPLMCVGFVVNAFAATQDVAVDGMAIDVLPENERGRANAFMACGQMAGIAAFTAISGFLLAQFGLAAAALVSAATVAAIFLFVAVLRERAGERLMPWSEGEAVPRSEPPAPSFRAIFADLRRVLFLPMSLVMIGVELLGRLRDGVALTAFPYFANQGLGLRTEIYTQLTGIVGFATAVLCLALGPFIDRYGPRRFMMMAFIGSAVCHLAVGLAPTLWNSPALMLALYSVNQLFVQIIFIALIALFMNLCWTKVAATQFAIYMSLSNLSRTLGSFLFSFVAERLGFAAEFLLMGLLLVAAAGMLLFFNAETHERRMARVRQQH